jgi:hypothetical protein
LTWAEMFQARSTATTPRFSQVCNAGSIPVARSTRAEVCQTRSDQVVSQCLPRGPSPWNPHGSSLGAVRAIHGPLGRDEHASGIVVRFVARRPSSGFRFGVRVCRYEVPDGLHPRWPGDVIDTAAASACGRWPTRPSRQGHTPGAWEGGRFSRANGGAEPAGAGQGSPHGPGAAASCRPSRSRCSLPR